MKLTETKLRSIIREELQNLSETSRTGVGGRVSGMEDRLEVYAMPNPEAGRYGGPRSIEVFVRRRGPNHVEFVEAMGPPGNMIEAPGFNEQYGDILAREIEEGKGENVTDHYTQSEIQDRLRY